MPLSLHDSKVTMFADDTNFASTSISIDDITKFMNAEPENVRKWLLGNKLTLNVAKTASVKMGSNRKLHQSHSLELIQTHFKISGEATEQKISVKCLEVTLYNQMKWKDHIILVASKVYRAIGMEKYAKKVLPTNLLKMLCLGQ